MMIKRVHVLVGIVTLIMFVATGFYMKLNFPALYQGNETIRMMYRASHIYILFAGLINIVIGSYISVDNAKHNWRQIVGSILIVSSAILFTTAFFYEPPRGSYQRTFTLLSILSISLGSLFHATANFRKKP